MLEKLEKRLKFWHRPLKWHFLWVAILFTLFWSALFWRSPMLGSESLMPLLPQHANMALPTEKEISFSPYSEYADQKLETGFYRAKTAPVFFLQLGTYRLPLLMQNQQGGLPFILYKLISQGIGPLLTKWLWHLFFGLVTLWLGSQVIAQLYRREWAILFLYLSALDPLQLFSYMPWISEPWLPALMALALYLILTERKQALTWGGFILSFGLYIKLSFIWFFPLLLCVGLKRIRRFIAPLSIGFVVGLIPLLFCWSASDFTQEHPLGIYPPLLPDLLRDLFSVLFQKESYLSFLSQWGPIDTNGHHAVKLWMSPVSLLLVLLMLLPFTPFWVGENKKFGLKIFGVGFGFILLMLLSLGITRQHPPYREYLFPLSYLIVLYWSYSLFPMLISQQRKLRFMAWAGLALWIAQFFLAMTPYMHHGAVPRYDVSSLKTIIQDLKRDSIRHPYLLSEWDEGRFEYLSGHEIYPLHLFDYLNHQSDFKMSLQKKLGTGTWIVHMQDTTPYGEWVKKFLPHHPPARMKVYRFRKKEWYLRIDWTL